LNFFQADGLFCFLKIIKIGGIPILGKSSFFIGPRAFREEVPVGTFLPDILLA